MRLLVDPCRYRQITPARPDRLGILATPRAATRGKFAAEHGLFWAADNDCFNGLDAPAYLRLLAACASLPPGDRPRWVCAPDVVGSHDATLYLWQIWEPVIRAAGLAAAFVLQDGATRRDVPLGNVAGVFVGGSTEWKMGDEARDLCAWAHGEGKWVHVGRVNTRKRIVALAKWGTVDSTDGTCWLRYSRHLPRGIEWVDHALGVGTLFSPAAD